MQLGLITLAVFALGYWSARTRMRQVAGNEGLPTFTRVFLGVMFVGLAALAVSLISTPGLPMLISEFCVLCAGQCLGYLLQGGSKKKD